jgi:hypothetical protein
LALSSDKQQQQQKQHHNDVQRPSVVTQYSNYTVQTEHQQLYIIKLPAVDEEEEEEEAITTQPGFEGQLVSLDRKLE